MRPFPRWLKLTVLIGGPALSLIFLIGLLVPGLVSEDGRAGLWQSFAGVTVATILFAFVAAKR